MWDTFSSSVRLKYKSGLTFEGEEVAWWRLTSFSHWSKVKFKSILKSCMHIFTCHLWICRYCVYWNLSYPLSILKVIFLKSKQTFDWLFLISVTYNLSFIFSILLYAKVSRSKFIEMHEDASDFYRSTKVTLVIYNGHRVKIMIYSYNCFHANRSER